MSTYAYKALVLSQGILSKHLQLITLTLRTYLQENYIICLFPAHMINAALVQIIQKSPLTLYFHVAWTMVLVSFTNA